MKGRLTGRHLKKETREGRKKGKEEEILKVT